MGDRAAEGGDSVTVCTCREGGGNVAGSIEHRLRCGNKRVHDVLPRRQTPGYTARLFSTPVEPPCNRALS